LASIQVERCGQISGYVGNMAIAEMTQTVKVVIDGNRLVMEMAIARTRELAEEAR
jgi:hypothetical protein